MNGLVALVVLLVLGSAPTEAQTKPKFFSSETTCLAALRSGDFTYYVPVDTTNRAKNLATGANRKIAPIEADACVHMNTTAGWQTVVRQSGSNFRWQLVNGTWRPYADDYCGNNADRVSYLPPSPVFTVAEEDSVLNWVGVVVKAHHTFDTLNVKVSGSVSATQTAQPTIHTAVKGSGLSTAGGIALGAGAVLVGGLTYLLLSGGDDDSSSGAPGGGTGGGFLWDW